MSENPFAVRRKIGRPRGVKDLRGRANRVDYNTRSGPIWLTFAARIGERLRALRTERQIASSELAAAVGVSTPTIHRLERGHVPGWPLMIALAIALDVPLVELLPAEAHHRVGGLRREAA